MGLVGVLLMIWVKFFFWFVLVYLKFILFIQRKIKIIDFEGFIQYNMFIFYHSKKLIL